MQAITRLLAVTDDGFDVDVLNGHLERDDKDDGVVVAKMQLLYMLQQVGDPGLDNGSDNRPRMRIASNASNLPKPCALC